MKKLLLSLLMIAPFLVQAQVANPEGSYSRVSNSGYTVSSTDESSNTPVDNLVDGDSTTFWETASGSNFPHTFTVNMQAPQNIDGIYFINRLNWVGLRNLDSVEIYTSVDSISWTLQVQENLATAVVANAPFSGGTVNCQYYKVIVYSVGKDGTNATSDYINLAETGALVKGSIPDPNAYSRVGWKIVSYSSQDNNDPGIAASAIDNNPNTYWQSQWAGTPEPYPHTIVIDMAENIPVNQIAYIQRITNTNSQVDSGTVAFSTDNVNWTAEIPLRFTHHATDGARTLINLPSTQTGRYMRLTALRNYYAANPAHTDSTSGSFLATTIAELGADYDQALAAPVKLSAPLTATIVGNAVQLGWITATELNNNYFQINRSIDGVHFEKLGTVSAANEAHSYSFTDLAPANGINYYQLVQVDMDGHTTTYNIVSAAVSATAKTFAVNISRPSSNNVTLNISAPVAGNVTIAIYNTAGQQVASQSATLNAGGNAVQVSLNGSTGVYIVNITLNGKRISKKFFKP